MTIGQETVGQIGRGYMVLLGIEDVDTEQDADYICDKIIGLRVFEDDQGKMNLGILDVNGAILLISQFTLYGDARHGRRPSFIKAARPEQAIPPLRIRHPAAVPVRAGGDRPLWGGNAGRFGERWAGDHPIGKQTAVLTLPYGGARRDNLILHRKEMTHDHTY